MTRDQKIAKARKMREQGMKLREIGERFGVSKGEAWRLCNYELWRERELARNDKKRAWENGPGRATCPACGAPMRAGSTSPTHTPARCQRCHNDDRRAVVDARGHQIEKWWAQGLTLIEIADRLGWTVNHLGREMNTLRSRGFDLPYRRIPRLEQAA